MNRYPTTDKIPAKDPTPIAPTAPNRKLANDPTATPPAKVAFCIWT